MGQLPSPKEVQAQAKSQYLIGVNPDSRRTFQTTAPYVRPPPVLFEHMNLLVKWGSAVKISEALVLFAINRYLKGRVPVPEGKSLEQVWDTMELGDRTIFCHHLRTAINHLHQLEQDPLVKFVGQHAPWNIVRAPLYDRALHIKYMTEAGPFATVHDFHNWFTFLHRRPMPDPYSVPVEPFRHELPDNCDIKFTHGDLHPSNIIVTPDRPYHILAVVDWEQSGWLPAYWEARKAQYTADRSEEWSTRYLPMILNQYSKTWDPWDYYTTAMGC
ncbi:hypothetical protein BGW36DRAFT_464748 [Talaromyces proteolyticus]|uniref:Aminoglycoside phosphotransferase domain-containing protein n=1 Tax=Talaromyces proteolyticus TaxID=1131652 RepID=A0AAD4KH27_9EURO|nr:uncharacterized protein BGW36DRAFT_464748 [Talaromyces proteolyticus]KAH8692208.1 hypothetical protein BGW36DRAFT_464748 [Talaromyces proteolyticus]